MKSTTKRALALLTSFAMCLTLAACGGQNTQTSETSSKSTSPQGEENVLEVWTYYDGIYYESVEDMLKKFEEETGIKSNITAVSFADFKSKLTMAATAEMLPDVVFIDNCDTVAYAEMGIFHDLTDDLKGNSDLDNYFDAIVESCTYDGRLYAVPAVSNNYAFYYNKDYFEEAGIESVPTNWDELLEVSQKLTNDKHYGLGLCMVSNEEGTANYLPWQLMAGGDYYNLNSDAGIRALTYLQKFSEAGVMPKDVVSWSQNDVSAQFQAGNVAIMELGCWFINDFDAEGGLPFNYGTFTLKDVTYGSIFGGENMAFIEGKHVAEEVKLAEWWIRPENNIETCYAQGQFSALPQTVDDPRYQTENWKPFADYIQYTTARPSDPDWPNISLGYQYAIQAVITGAASPEDAAATGQNMIDEARK